MNTIKIIGSPLYQWEIGRKIQIMPFRNLRISAVHFSNMGDAEALVVEPKEENGLITADIPNILMQDKRNIVVYVVDVSADCVETLRECVLPVRPRPRPSDYVYTETEVLTWHSLAEQIKEIKENGTGGMPDNPEQIALLIETDMLPAVHENGAILTDESGNIILRY